MDIPRRPRRVALAVVGALLAVACASGPQPIAYGTDACESCRMTITDPRFGAEIVTTKGRVRKFDSIECMAEYYVGAERAKGVRSAWVSDFQKPGTFIAAAGARFYVATDGASTPMGQGIAAFAGAPSTAEAKMFAGAPLTWTQVVERMRQGGHRVTIAAGDGEVGRVAP